MSGPTSDRAPVILVIDDDETFSEIISWWLVSVGYTPVRCADPSAARAALDEHDVAAVICDIELGSGAIGTDVVAELRTQVDRLPAIFVSGYRSEFVAYSRDSDRDAFLQKPFELSALGDALAHYVAVPTD